MADEVKKAKLELVTEEELEEEARLKHAAAKAAAKPA